MISFVHRIPGLASYRYRCEIPAKGLGLPINQEADGYIITKPTEADLALMDKPTIVDFCDDHFNTKLYRQMAAMADFVTCPTVTMASIIKQETGRLARVIPDPYEFPEKAPHCNGKKLLWFGHASNYYTLERILPDLKEYELHVVSNKEGCIPYSRETMEREFAWADIVIIPATKAYKSPNRAIEAIRSGCLVIAEPHPSLYGFPIFQGHIKEGIECLQMNQMKEAQQYVRDTFSPQIVTAAWKKLLTEFHSILDAGKRSGMDGSTLTTQTPMSIAT